MTTFAFPARASSRAGMGSLYVIAFAAAAVGAGTGRAVTTTYLPVLLDRIDDAPGLIGLVMLVNAGAGFSVPLVIGYWSDQRRARGLGARLPFVLGGSLLAAGGLTAVALGASSTYLALAVFAATVYIGLNAITTAHRALVAELFGSGERARATSAQELALLAGGLLGLAAGGILAGVALWAPFAAAALLLPLTALPTVLGVDEPHAATHEPQERHALRYYLAVATRPGVRGLLLAEWLWVMGYAALPAFFILYAEKVLDLSLARASLVLAAFGLVTAVAMFAAGRVKRTELLRPLLLGGIALMGGGLLAVPLSTNLLATTPALIAAAAGFGIVSTVGFPFLASMIPDGEAGAYTALFFSVRAIGSTVALPLAGALIALTESYRTLFVLGGTVTLLGLVALAGIHVPETRLSAAWARRWTTSIAALYAAVLGTGVLVAGTGLQGLDEMVFRWVNALGPGPELLFDVLEQPARNYALLGAIILGAALLTRPQKLGRLFALELVSVGLALALLQALYAVFDRPRPSEVFERAEIALAYGHNWASIESFPSGHMAVVTALAASAWFAIPQLRGILVAYIVLNAFTRVSFGAHFPADVVAGAALGYGSALAGRSLFAQTAALREPAAKPELVTLSSGNTHAVMPSHGDVPDRKLVEAVLDNVGGLTIVDDGSDPDTARELDRITEELGVELVRLPEHRGKGAALRAGVDAVLARQPPPEAALLIDADSQHPPSAIPALLEAASSAEVVIGDRFDDLGAMPLKRRLANQTSRRLLELTTGHRVRDTQSGFRVLRGRALALPIAGNGYEAETRHLKSLLVRDVDVAWVPIPAIYGDERSGFRSVRDSARVVAALLGPVGRNGQSRSRSQRRGGFRRARPTRSEPRDTRATGRPCLQGPGGES
ncbi:MAG TPA: MFS transporter [Gaiellaceae bacterium]|nr:MFS transporter [Gaiellaceae bacterium]